MKPVTIQNNTLSCQTESKTKTNSPTAHFPPATKDKTKSPLSSSLFTLLSEMYEENKKNKNTGAISEIEQDENREESYDHEKEEPSSDLAYSPVTMPFFYSPSAANAQGIQPYNGITTDVLSFFDRICGEMIVTASENSNKTTLVLNTSSFASSPLYGSEIVIEEFSTAPKIFNVSISSSPQGLALIQAHLADFWEIFKERKFPFGINRMDVGLSSKRDFSRKPDEKQDSTDYDLKDREYP